MHLIRSNKTSPEEISMFNIQVSSTAGSKRTFRKFLTGRSVVVWRICPRRDPSICEREQVRTPRRSWHRCRSRTNNMVPATAAPLRRRSGPCASRHGWNLYHCSKDCNHSFVQFPQPRYGARSTRLSSVRSLERLNKMTGHIQPGGDDEMRAGFLGGIGRWRRGWLRSPSWGMIDDFAVGVADDSNLRGQGWRE